MTYGSISYNAHASLARAAEALGIYYNTGEGGLHEDFYQYGANTIVQVASGRFGVHKDYLEAGAAIEIKMGQGAKPGIGGHLPGAKIVGDVSSTRMIPEGADAISPAPHHDIYSIEDLRQLVYSLEGGHRLQKAGHRQDRRGAQRGRHRQRHRPQRRGHHRHRRLPGRHRRGAHPHPGQRGHPHRAGAGQRWTSACGTRASATTCLVVVGGSIRSSADVVKAIALGADACLHRHQPPCWPWAATCAAPARPASATGASPPSGPSWSRRLNPDMGCQRLVNLDHRLEPRDQGDDGRHGHQLHRGPAGQPADAPGHRADRPGAGDSGRGPRRGMNFR